MNLETLESLQSEFHSTLFLYPWDFFELRIQEEMIRADRSKSGFSYLEISFDALRNLVKPQVDDRSLWRTTLQFLAETMRGSDLKGFLSGNTGIGLVFLDSSPQGALECRSRYWRRLQDLGWLLDESGSKGEDLFRVTHYPLETTH